MQNPHHPHILIFFSPLLGICLVNHSSHFNTAAISVGQLADNHGLFLLSDKWWCKNAKRPDTRNNCNLSCDGKEPPNPRLIPPTLHPIHLCYSLKSSIKSRQRLGFFFGGGDKPTLSQIQSKLQFKKNHSQTLGAKNK